MTNREKYIEYANNTFDGKSRELVLKQIDLFYNDNITMSKHNYKIGDDVKLKKGTFMHGIPGLLDNFDWTIENGFVAIDFTGNSEGKNKIKNSIGMWNIKEDILLDFLRN